MIRSALTALALSLAMTQAALAAPPAVGTIAPEVSGLTVKERPVRKNDVVGENGVALVFVRSADWCPFCKAQLEGLNSVAADMAAAGWPLAGISYDSPATLKAFSEAKGLSYPLISDTGSATITAFGLLNETHAPGSRFHGIPHPAIVFIAADGTVKAVLQEEGYRNRPETEVVLETAKALNAG
jgi:peroxiredoxin Q/BCP